ncbi:MAG: hypothetical protein QOI63_1167 [Thermoplasmata archaeon]|jgi:hypothetical protein|nr:hypothetical protein [Thermoplasmata archaeon]
MEAIHVRTLLKPRLARVQFADPNAPAGVEITTAEFLKECRLSALARFRARRDPSGDCRSVEHVVPPKLGDHGSTGSIIAHLGTRLCDAWEADALGTTRERAAHVEEQVQLALEDLAEQDMHGYLALTEEQRALYAPDLEQLVTEAFDRTTFSHLHVKPQVNWEGTLVQSVRPPHLILVVSISL